MLHPVQSEKQKKKKKRPTDVCGCWFTNRSPYVEDRDRPKTEAGHLRLVGGRFNKGTPHLPARILRAFLEALTGFSHIAFSGSQQPVSLSRLHPWKWLPVWEQWAEGTHQGQGSGEESLMVWVWLRCQLVDSLQWDSAATGWKKG